MFSSLGGYVEVFTALCLTHVKRREELGRVEEGSPRRGAPGAQSDYWFPVYSSRRLCSNMTGILGCISRTSEGNIALVAIATNIRAMKSQRPTAERIREAT